MRRAPIALALTTAALSVAGADVAAAAGDTWDLEAKRPVIAWDRINDWWKLGHQCNWDS